MTSPTNEPPAPELPHWLPDESTLNRLAGEFFAAMPGLTLPGLTLPGLTQPGLTQPGSSPTQSSGLAGTAPAGLVGGGDGGVDHAPRVDVPAQSNSISHVPGDTGSEAAVPAVSGAPGGLPAVSAPGLTAADPAATLGLSPSRSIPDLTEATAGALGVYGLGAPMPEAPLVPGVTGLELAPTGDTFPAVAGPSSAGPSALGPSLSGLTAPFPAAGAPGVPASDQFIGAGGLPNGPPDVTEAAQFIGGGFGSPGPTQGAAVGAVPFSPAGELFVPAAPGGEMVPPLHGLSAPLPSAGLPGIPASDQTIGGAGVPGGPPDVTGATPLGTVGAAGPPFTAPEGAAAPSARSFVLDSRGLPGQAPTVSPLATSDPFSSPLASTAPSTTSSTAPSITTPSSTAPSSTASAAPFTAGTGPQVPGVPPVSAVPGFAGANGLPASPSSADRGSADTSTGFNKNSGGLGALESVPTPSLPQPPLALPDAPAPIPTPSTPYYFISETSPYRGAGDSGLDTLVGAALNPSQVAPPSLDSATSATDGGPAGAAGGSPVGVDPAVAAPALPAAFNGPFAVPASGGKTPSVSPAFYFADRPVSPSTPATDLAHDPHPPFDVRLVRRDFPILSERVNGKPLVWLDNAATTQKPQAVLDRLAHFYEHENSNIHRAAHELAARATDAYEGARKTIARFIGAGSEKDIVFVRGATEAINLVAKSWGKKNIHAGDEIIVSHLEHHANIVPWQQLVAETGAKLRVIPVDDSGQILLNEYAKLLCEKTKLVSVTQVSNALGTVTPIEQIVEMGHRAGACVLVDGAQSVPHLRVNMQTLGADFFVFSGHKIFGPTGIGVLYGRSEVLEEMPPWEGGGNMIADVTFEKTVFQKPPNRFEAGTGNIADAVGLGAALDYVSRLGLETVANYEHSLLEYATPRMKAVRGLRMIGTAANKASVLSFVLDGYRTEEVGAALNQEGVAVRSGHHCAQPILRRFGVEATVRPSLAFYNTREEIDLLVTVLHRLAADRGRR